ncbi:MAG: zinc ribbon domain-containing protein [Clostridia bacterium]|nr:zinc ribbon domain-containing protein [Clostridia bacterium]
MPTYQYRCEHCGIFEETQKITAPPLEHCPRCGGQVQRLISPNINIIFKGPGFYCTDNRKPSYTPSHEESSTGASNGGSSGASSSTSGGTSSLKKAVPDD